MNVWMKNLSDNNKLVCNSLYYRETQPDNKLKNPKISTEQHQTWQARNLKHTVDLGIVHHYTQPGVKSFRLNNTIFWSHDAHREFH